LQYLKIYKALFNFGGIKQGRDKVFFRPDMLQNYQFLANGKSFLLPFFQIIGENKIKLFEVYSLHLSRNSSLLRSGVARRGEQVGARALGRRPWGRNSTLFAVILNVFLSKKLDQSMLKNAYFWEKTVKIVSASGAEPPFASSSWGFRTQTPALLLPPTITTLSSSFLVLNAFYSAQKRN